MDWLINIGETWRNGLCWLAGMGVVFSLLSRWSPCNPGMSWLKDPRALATDLVYWFIVPLCLSVCRTLMLVAGLVLMALCHVPRPLMFEQWPLWQQAVAVVLIQDVLLYGIHRLFHSRLGWKFHAVHHSPQVLDWISTVRFHPVNNLLEFALADVLVVLLGFTPATVVALMPFNFVYSAMVHANLNWTFGPLRHLFASPVFHRWHHTTQDEGLDKNFAPTFPFLDLLFGTFHMPAGRVPEQYGSGDPDFPTGFWGQFVYPLRATPPSIGLTSQSDTDDKSRSLSAGRWQVAANLAVMLTGGGVAYFRTQAITGRLDAEQTRDSRSAQSAQRPVSHQ